jgi:2-dehydro-3-deoxyphosphogluconate aldolase/(4S)-4-hydroxy-2-oxoglutarate aldolase
MTGSFSRDKFMAMPIIAIARNINAEDLSALLPAFHQSGFTTLEITMNSAGAKEMISEFSRLYAGVLNIGAGTVCTIRELELALSSGAQFIVTPVTEIYIIEACVANRIPVFPGAFTPTEIVTAWRAGADMVKVFPAAMLGPAYIKEIKAPLNQIKLIPTGGINAENCISFLRAGADALGMGGQLLDSGLIRQKNWTALSAHFSEIVQRIRLFRKENESA